MMGTVRRMRPVIQPYLPAAPLATAIAVRASRSDVGTVCERAGIPERVYFRWRVGEQGGRVDLGLADQVMTRLGLFWWDIWTVDTVREPLFVVTTYVNCRKKNRHGASPMRRVKVRTIPYGDLGTDFWRLREIETLMRGQFEVAA